MKTIPLFTLVCIFGNLPFLSFTHCQDGGKYEKLFVEYLQASARAATERNIPQEDRDQLEKEANKIKNQILARPNEAAAELHVTYQAWFNQGDMAMCGQLMNFAGQTGVARSSFIVFARDAIKSTNLNEPRDSLLSTAIEYIGDHGDATDLELFSLVDSHINSAYARIRDRAAMRLKERLLKEGLELDTNVPAVDRRASGCEKFSKFCNRTKGPQSPK